MVASNQQHLPREDLHDNFTLLRHADLPKAECNACVGNTAGCMQICTEEPVCRLTDTMLSLTLACAILMPPMHCLSDSFASTVDLLFRAQGYTLHVRPFHVPQ